MDFENQQEQKNRIVMEHLPVGFDSSYKGEYRKLDKEISKRYGIAYLGDFPYPFDFDTQKGGNRISPEDMVQMLIDRGWLSEDILERAYNDDPDTLDDFLMNLAWLSYEADQSNLSQDEIQKIKSDVGLISIDALRDSLNIESE